MAYLPEPVELDELGLPLPPGDTVVRTPRAMFRPAGAPPVRNPLASLNTSRSALSSRSRSLGSSIRWGRLLAIVFALAALAVGTVFLVRALKRKRQPTKTPPPAVQAPALVPLEVPVSNTPAAPAQYNEKSQRLGKGGSLPATLRALGMAGPQVTCVIDALRPIMNMRALQPTDLVVAQTDALDGTLRRVEYRRSETAVWGVTFTPELACHGERLEVTRTTERVVTGFKVDGPLPEILERARLRTEIVPLLQQAFDSLGLPNELHRDDVVRLIVEEVQLNGSFFRYGHILALDLHTSSGTHRGFFDKAAHDGELFDELGTTRGHGPLQAPLDDPKITSRFDMHRMHPVLHREMPHLGMDFGSPMGAPVYSSAEGEVIHVGDGGPAGNLVRLSHPALEVETGYAHLSRFAPGLSVGMKVPAHTLLGYVGSTGRSTGPHLHFSVKKQGQFIDPMSLYGARRSIPQARRMAFEARMLELSNELDAIAVNGSALAPTMPAGTSTSSDAGMSAETGVNPIPAPEPFVSDETDEILE